MARNFYKFSDAIACYPANKPDTDSAASSHWLYVVLVEPGVSPPVE